MKLARIGKEFVNLEKVQRVIDNVEKSNTLVILFESLIEESSSGESEVIWSSKEFYGDEAKALLDWLNRNSTHIA